MVGALLFWIFCGIIAGMIGSRKGEGCLSFIIGLIFGPFGILFALISKGNRKQCPTCKEYVHEDATKCPKCHAVLSSTPQSNERAHFEEPSASHSSEDKDFEEKWATIIQYDETARLTIKKVEEQCGGNGVTKLKKVFRHIGDISKLPQLSEQIIVEFTTSKADADTKKSDLMKKYGIQFDGGKYIYGEFKYDKLEDAVSYAELQLKIPRQI